MTVPGQAGTPSGAGPEGELFADLFAEEPQDLGTGGTGTHVAPAAPAGANPTLASRMRPRNLDELVGGGEALAPGGFLRVCCERGQLPSVILCGPPGCGKTTIARLIAAVAGYVLEPLGASSAGVGDVRDVVARARKRLQMGVHTALFIDEIHRFNKAQQDVILPLLEEGVVRLIGATTENPGLSVNRALLSRVRVVRIPGIGEEDMEKLLDRALADPERGLGRLQISIDVPARELLLAASSGDARVMLDTLEIAASGRKDGERTVTAHDVKAARASAPAAYDRGGDIHYWTVSALIKSVRGSDADAGLFWLARLLEGGADPLFVARRLVLLASEDIGLADPGALQLAVGAHAAVAAIGMPEGYLPLAEAVVYLALAPKSNAVYAAYTKAREDALSDPVEEVPVHLRNAVTPLDAAAGYGKEYVYPHGADPNAPFLPYRPTRFLNNHYWTGAQNGQNR